MTTTTIDSFEHKVKLVKEKVRASTDYPNITDTMFVRFLRGHKGNVDNAVKGLLAAVTFRKETKADTLSIDDCIEYYNRRVTFLEGKDKNGRPILNSMVHRHDPSARDITQVRNFIIYIIDQALKVSKPEEEKVAIIFDLSQFSMRCMDFEVTKVFVTILQTHYPEILGQAYIVNSPFIFKACWRIIRPWLDPVTAEKVQFITSSQITNFVDADKLSEEIRVSFQIPIERKDEEKGLLLTEEPLINNQVDPIKSTEVSTTTTATNATTSSLSTTEVRDGELDEKLNAEQIHEPEVVEIVA